MLDFPPGSLLLVWVFTEHNDSKKKGAEKSRLSLGNAGEQAPHLQEPGATLAAGLSRQRDPEAGSRRASLSQRAESSPGSLQVRDRLPAGSHGQFPAAARLSVPSPPPPGARGARICWEMLCRGPERRLRRFAPLRFPGGVNAGLPNLIENGVKRETGRSAPLPCDRSERAIRLVCEKNPREKSIKRREVTNTRASRAVAFTRLRSGTPSLRRWREEAAPSGRPGAAPAPKAEPAEPVLHLEVSAEAG